MLKNYIITALRQFTRHKMFSALNVICLAVGISFCVLIGQYILHETRINSNLKDYHQQYFMMSDWKEKQGPEMTTVGPLSKALKTQYPSLVKNYFRYNPVVNVVSAGEKHFKEDVSMCDMSLISTYGLTLLHGDPEHAFPNLSSVVITEAFANKLFGETNVINRTVTFTNLSGKTTDYTVSGVLKSGPYTTITNEYASTPEGFAMFIPLEGNQYYGGGGSGEEDWSGIYTVSFVQLQPGIKPAQLDAPIKKLLTTNSPETISKHLRVNLKSLDEVYLTNNNGVVKKTLSILSLVALSILLLAVINFVNIMIGTSSYRIREIGLRKVFGSMRRQLIFQYLVEAIVLTLFAALLSVLLYGAFRPMFNDLLHTELPVIYQFRITEILGLGAVVLVVGILAGIYPAFILSGSEVISSVKGKLGFGDKGGWMRKSLLVLQFTIAIGVFIFSMALSKQVNYFFNKDLGYNKDRLLVITAFPKQWDSAGVARMETIRDNIRTSSSVLDASVSFDIPERVPPNQMLVIPEGAKTNTGISTLSIGVDEQYAETYGMQVTGGRFFRDKIGGFVSGEVVINESAAKRFGWKNPIGKTIGFTTGPGNVTVVGVIKDFHLASLHENIGPLILFQVKDNRAYRFLTVKLKPGNLTASIEDVRKKWKEIAPSAPFEFNFMDEKLQSMYRSELQLKMASAIATGLMLTIVLLGIFGVLTLALNKRNKEIAVRKVLGAEIRDILALFIKQYAGLLLIANVIAWPLAWYFGNQWLQQFAYRIIQPLGIYFIAGVFVSVVAFLLITLQCLKVATANPVKSLRSE